MGVSPARLRFPMKWHSCSFFCLYTKKVHQNTIGLILRTYKSVEFDSWSDWIQLRPYASPNYGIDVFMWNLWKGGLAWLLRFYIDIQSSLWMNWQKLDSRNLTPRRKKPTITNNNNLKALPVRLRFIQLTHTFIYKRLNPPFHTPTEI